MMSGGAAGAAAGGSALRAPSGAVLCVKREARLITRRTGCGISARTSEVHICGAVAAGTRVRAVSHLAFGEENADTATASANAIAHRRAGRRRSALGYLARALSWRRHRNTSFAPFERASPARRGHHVHAEACPRGGRNQTVL